MKLYAIILTFNESAHITACIEAVRFCDRVIVFDSYSEDDTPVLALEAGAELIQRRFDDYASQRNAALDAVAGRADWVLFVDADERVTPKLENEILDVLDNAAYAGWQMPRDNIIFGKLTRGAGWSPDYQTRLLRVGKARYDPAKQVHEVVQLDGALGTLKTALVHYNYRDAAQFRDKQRRYTFYDAMMLYESGVRPKPYTFVTQPVRQWWWRFITLKGYADGLHGLRLSLLMAWYEYRKVALLTKLWQDAAQDPTPTPSP